MAKITRRMAAAFHAFRGGSPPEAPPTGEIAFADPRRLFPGGYWAPYNPSALVRGRGLAIFDAMRRDDQVKAALAFKKYTAIVTGWEVTSPEGKPDDWEPTRFVQWVLENLDPNEIGSSTLDGDLYEILSALDYGYSVTEKIWAPIETGPFDGALGLSALKTRAPHYFRFAQDEYGNIPPDGVIQQMNSKVKDGKLPRAKFVLFNYQSQFGNPYGCSDLEAAYQPWWTKDNATKWLAMLLEALGIPPIFGLYDPHRYSPSQIDDLKTIFTNLQARTFGIIPKPGGTSSAGNDALSFWSPELAGQATRVFIPSLEHLDQRIARAILMPSLLGMTGDTSQGSFARARVHFDVFLLVVEAIRKDLEIVAMANQIVRPLVDLNYPGLDAYPQWSFLPLTDDLRLKLLDTWEKLVAGGIVSNSDEDEDYARRLTKFPPRQPGAVRKSAVPPSATPGQGAPPAAPPKPTEPKAAETPAEPAKV